jgi:transposase-like protein
LVAAARRKKVTERSVARRFGVTLSTVQYWVRWAKGKRLDRVDWSDRSRAPCHPQRTSQKIEQEVLRLRKWLKEQSVLGEYGAPAIYREMQTRRLQPCPAISTISRILQRHGVLDGHCRVRRPPPAKGWYIADVAERKSELDSFDTIEGLLTDDGAEVTVLTGVSLHGGLTAAWTGRAINAKTIVEHLVEHWRAVGLPAYAQFDNDTRFQGPRQYADTIGRVMRLCLSLGVIPVFAPPNETGFQATIESFNGLWQAKVWTRFKHTSLRGLAGRSAKYITASRKRRALRSEAAPARRSFPKRWRLDLQKHPTGNIVFLRRTDNRGRVSVLERRFLVDPNWPHRLVRAVVDLDQGTIRFYALRRRDPTHQPLLKEVPYTLPKRQFRE